MSDELTLQGFFSNEREGKLAVFTPNNCSFDEWKLSAMMAITGSPTLLECLKDKAGQVSLHNALRVAAATGLSLNPQEGKSALIAYGKKAQYQVMKNGWMELAEKSGRVKFITSDTVRANDVWDLEKTPEGDRYSFKPARKDRGEIDGFFAAIVMKNGSSHVKYMTVEQVKEHRAAYSAGYNYAKSKNKNDHVWIKSFEGMGLKTVIKALFRNIDISPEVSSAVGVDDQEEVGQDEPKDITPKPDKGVGEVQLLEKLEAKKEDNSEPTGF